ncbi:hypothetical protein O3M35_003805 [Rhynocoris fuscipes]|uniref:Histone acetyltransferase type B catalytic subunit n=1 Tax=Rhynocoris fuscipes TaxID=488301 RepID=A0AAW1CNS3_9HEMI
MDFINSDDLRKQFTVDGNDSMEIKLIRNPDDLHSDSCSFKPDMCHQIFVPDEQIFGYKGLKIKLYYTAGNLTTYVGMEYEERISAPGMEPDDVMKSLRKVILTPFETNFSEFERLLEADDTFRPHGELIHSCTVGDSNNPRTLEIYVNTTSDSAFLEYYKRAQTFVLLYIDAANYVNPDDGDWIFFLVYEKYRSVDMSVKYGLVGYASVYEYYAYPANIRPRMSQILVLPPFRRMGICVKLINAIYQYYVPNNRVVDITVESPSVEFQRVRDYVDCINCMTLDEFSSNKLRCGINQDMFTQAKNKFKINRKQILRVYEILRLYYTNLHNDKEYKAYLHELKERRLKPNKRVQTRKKKFMAFFGSDPEVIPPTLPEEEDSDSEEQALLESQLHNVLVEYEAVINRINKDGPPGINQK